MVRSARQLIIAPVTPNTGDRDTHILVFRSTCMTCLTIDRCVSAKQWKARLLVLLDHIGNLPRQSSMATEAVCAQFTLMDVGVTRKTLRFHLGKLQILVT